MIVSHKHKFIFIRPQKVAGTSVMVALGDCLGGSDVLLLAQPELRSQAGLDGDDFPTLRQRNDGAVSSLPVHALPRAMRDALEADVWQSYLKFTIVRNPWEWFVSLHVWWMRHLWDEVKVSGARGALRRHRRYSTLYRRGRALGQAQRLLRSGHRKESVELALRRDLYPGQLAEMEQFYFLDGRRCANRYLRYENLQEDFDGLCERLGIEPRALPKAKTELRQGDVEYQRYYTPYSRRRIAAHCGRVVEEFGYAFD